MSESRLTSDKLLLSALTYGFAFEILKQLKTQGMTTRALLGKLPNSPSHKALSVCLNRMQGAGLLFQIRTDATSEWWLNRMGIADAGVRLTEIAAMLPERSLETISKVSRQNASALRLTQFFSIPYRREILRALSKREATPGEIFKDISSDVGLPAITVSLRMLQEFGLVSSEIKLINKALGGFLVKQYHITSEGSAMVVAFERDNSLQPIVRAATAW